MAPPRRSAMWWRRVPRTPRRIARGHAWRQSENAGSSRKELRRIQPSVGHTALVLDRQGAFCCLRAAALCGQLNTIDGLVPARLATQGKPSRCATTQNGRAIGGMEVVRGTCWHFVRRFLHSRGHSDRRYPCSSAGRGKEAFRERSIALTALRWMRSKLVVGRLYRRDGDAITGEIATVPDPAR